MECGEYLFDGGEDQHMDLPPGFRFYPTDEELITHYLSNKVADGHFVARAIGEVDLNKVEPWDLPWRAKMGEKEWYFFSVRDRKYPTGLRTNRATDAGYWKATGKDKEIHRGKDLVGMKKTLVFYRGRAPKGEKTNWVTHEYRLDGKLSLYNLPKTAKNEWVLCRVFHKSFSATGGGGGGGAGGKKAAAGMVRTGSSSYGEDMMMGMGGGAFSLMPPLMDAMTNKVARASPAAAHVTCFSNSVEGHRSHDEQGGYAGCSSPLFYAPAAAANPTSELSPLAALLLSKKGVPEEGLSGLQLSGEGLVQLLQSHGYVVEEGCKAEREVGGSLSQETGLTSDVNPEISSEPSHHETRKLFLDGQKAPFASFRNLPLGDSIWNY